MKRTVQKAKAIIIQNNKVLMLKKVNKDFKQSLPGGNLKKKETKKEGLIREIYEELGVHVVKNNLQYIIGYTIHSSIIDASFHYFLLKKPEGNFIVGEPDKFDSLCWMNINDVFTFVDKYEKIVLKDLLIANKKTTV